MLKTQSGADNRVSARVGSFQIALTQRGSNKLYVQEGDLLKNGAGYTGQVECDGGGVALQQMRTTGALMYLGHPNGGKYLRVAVMPDPCGEGDQRITQSIDIVPGTDDVTFLSIPCHCKFVIRYSVGSSGMPSAGQTNKDVEGGVGD